MAGADWMHLQHSVGSTEKGQDVCFHPSQLIETIKHLNKKNHTYSRSNLCLYYIAYFIVYMIIFSAGGQVHGNERGSSNLWRLETAVTQHNPEDLAAL